MHGSTSTHHSGEHWRALRRLTPRQTEVLTLMAEGQSNSAIAESLVISEKAVVRHTSHIYDRLQIHADDAVHRRVLAVVRYLSHAVAAPATAALRLEPAH
jgi:DNA-binding NarL/FixJ family response regulator